MCLTNAWHGHFARLLVLRVCELLSWQVDGALQISDVPSSSICPRVYLPHSLPECTQVRWRELE